MSESKNSIQSRSKPKIPSYIHSDPRGRDSFLSQIGAVDSESRSLFNSLCDMKAPWIPIEKAVKELQNQYPAIKKMLDKLMRQLVKGRCGLITLILKGDVLKKDRIILTERDDPLFWYWYIKNAWLTIRNSDNATLPTVEDYKRIKGFPADGISPLTAKDISKEYARNCADEIRLCSFQSTNKDRRLLFTPASIVIMADIAKARIRNMLLYNTTLQNELIRYLNIPVNDLQKIITAPDSNFWLQVCSTIIAKQENLHLKRINITPDVIHSVSIIQAYIQNELTEAEKHLRDEEEKSKVLKSILFAIAKHKKLLMESTEFIQQFVPYDDKWPDLQTEFTQRYMSELSRKSLPPVVNVGLSYLHRDNIYILFKSLHNTAISELHKHYMKRFSNLLRSRNRSKFSELSSVESFRGNIKDKIAEDFPSLYILLKNPRLTADGILHYGTKVLNKNNMELVRNVLERYFMSNTAKFKPYDELFSLNLLSLFEDTFLQLSLLQRVLMRISGGYDSYIRQYNPFIQHSAVNDMQNEKKKIGRKKRKKEVAVAKNTKSGLGNSGKEAQPERSVRSKSKISRSERVYSARQREMAWSELNDAFRKKTPKE